MVAEFAGDPEGNQLFLKVQYGDIVHANLGHSTQPGYMQVVNRCHKIGLVPTAKLELCTNTLDFQPYTHLLELFKHIFGSWVITGSLFGDDKLQISEDTSTAFSKMQQEGESYMAATGLELTWNAFDMLELMDDNPDQQKKLCQTCAESLHGKLEFGPFFAEALGLMDHFSESAELGWNQESLAHSLDAIFGGLIRHRLNKVVQAFVHFCVTVLIAICENGGNVVNTMTSIMGTSPHRCVQLECGKWAGHVIRDLSSLFPLRLMGSYDLKANIAKVHTELLLAMISPPVLFVPESLTEQIPFTHSDWHCHPHDPCIWRWFLQCVEVDCDNEFLTPWGRGDHEAMTSAFELGWGKTKSKSWRWGCRCPNHL